LQVPHLKKIRNTIDIERLKELKGARTTTGTAKFRPPGGVGAAHLRLRTVDVEQARGSYHSTGFGLNETAPLNDLNNSLVGSPTSAKQAYRDILSHTSTNPKF